MKPRTDLEKRALRQAANILPVYTREVGKKEAPLPQLVRGCFSCSHSVGPLGSGNFQSIWVWALLEPTDMDDNPEPKPICRFMINRNDNWWQNSYSAFHDMPMKGMNKFPLLNRTYISLEAARNTDGMYVRQYRLPGGTTRHVNSMVGMPTLLAEANDIETPTDLYLLWGPGHPNTYIDLKTNITPHNDHELDITNLRFRSKTDQKLFIMKATGKSQRMFEPVKPLSMGGAEKPIYSGRKRKSFISSAAAAGSITYSPPPPVTVNQDTINTWTSWVTQAEAQAAQDAQAEMYAQEMEMEEYS